mmetsp:Transcript_47652/g.132584  ORF Transcript_47652/g.132584 Transcript_47652/m.132584 type:complete len:211 (+) Transcript_47652:651-1283(+)
MRPHLLGVVEPCREQGHVAHGCIGGDVRQLEQLPAESAPWTVLATHLVVADVPEAVLRAVAPIVVCEVPAVPADLAEARGLQVLEVLRVRTRLDGAWVEPRLNHFRWHDRHLVAKPQESKVQLVDPSHPQDGAGSHRIKPDVTARFYVRALLLPVLAPIQQQLLHGCALLLAERAVPRVGQDWQDAGPVQHALAAGGIKLNRVALRPQVA